MTSHVSAPTLRRFRGGELPAEEILAVGRHLAECHECADLAATLVDIRRAAQRLADATITDGHPDPETELAKYAAGRGSEAVAEHVAGCAVCREDVEDRRSVAPRPRPMAIIAALAAAVAIVFAAIAFWPRPAAQTPPVVSTAPPALPRPPDTPPSRYGRADWDRLVAEARRTGVLPVAAVLAELRPSPDTFRDSPAAAKSMAAMHPAGVVVESTRPRFAWSPLTGAKFVVSVYDGPREVARSGELDTPGWIVDRDLRRGRTYAWQVEVVHDGVTSVLPEPPAPPAMFRVADAAAVREIEEARRRFPDDPFLHAVIQARHGIVVRSGGW